MSVVTSQDSGDFAEGVVQLRFTDDDGTVRDINAAELAEVLQGLVELTSQLASAGAFGDGLPPVVRVRPAKEGSFILEAVVAFVDAYPVESLATAMTLGGGVAQAINVGLKRLRGAKSTDFEHQANGLTKVKWANGDVNEVSAEAWKQLNAMKRPTQRALRKILAPLSDDVDRLEVREMSAQETTDEALQKPAEVIATKEDYRAAAAEEDEVSEEVKNFEIEAQLASIDFRPGEKWRVKTIQGSRLATMEDEAFLLEVDRGLALHKNDIFSIWVRENSTTKNGRTTKEWAVTQVTFKRRGDDDGDDSFAS